MSNIKEIIKELASKGLTDINDGSVKIKDGTPYNCTNYALLIDNNHKERYEVAKDGVDISSLIPVKQAVAKIQKRPSTQFSARSGKGGDDKPKGDNAKLSR